MRKTISLLTIIALVFACSSCGGEAKKKIKEAKDSVSAVKNMTKSLSKIEESSKQINKDMEKLKNVEPFSNDRFQKWMPENLDGMKRTSFGFTSAMGSQGEMKFVDESNGERTFDVTIIDGAGEMGSMIYASQGFITGFMDDYHSESDTKVEKIVKRNGGKALETYYKEEKTCEIKAVIDNRFIVSANAEGMSTDEVWKLIDKLNIGNLK